MASEIRANSITSRAGLSTVTLTDSGPMFSGITTFVDNSTFSVGTGGTIHAPATNTLNIGVNNTESLRIDSNSNLKVAGIVTATSFSGSGANLTSLPAQATIANNADNRVITGGSGVNLNGEANLTWNGTKFGVGTASPYTFGVATFNDSNGIVLEGSSQGRLLFRHTGGGTNLKMFDLASSDGVMKFRTIADNGTTVTERLRIDSSGRLLVGSTSTNQNISKIVVKASSPSDNYDNHIYLEGSETSGDANTGGVLGFGGHDGSSSARNWANIWGVKENSTDGNTASYMAFHTRPNGGNPTERLRITSEGYLKIVDNGVTQTNTTLSYQSEGAFLTHYTARTTAGGDRYRRMLDIASVGANPHGSSIRLLTSPDDTNPATTVERVRITHEGRVGIKYSTPQTMLSIKAERSAVPRFGIDGHYSDSSYTQCSWDDSSGLYTLLGVNHKLDANGNDAAAIASLHSSSILLDGRSGNIRFNIKPNSGTATTEVMRIRDTGCVHIGNSLASAASGRLQVVEERGGQQTNDCNVYFETNANDWNLKTYYNSPGAHYHIVFIEQGSTRGSITGNDGSNVTYNQGSDYRWKENIVEMTGSEGIDICKKLKPRKYNWIENREETEQINTVDGFIAHEVEEAGVLGAVTGEKDAVNEDGSIKGQMLDYGQMTPVLAAAIKGLITKVETLEQDNIALRVRVTNLEGN